MTDTVWNPSDCGPFIVANSLTAGGVVAYYGFALDITNKKAWVWNPWRQQWNGDIIANQNPATATGGVSFSGVTGAIFAGYSGATGGQSTTYNFGATGFRNAAPSGYSSWNTLAGTTTLNPSDKSANVTLSGGNLTAASSVSWSGARSTTSLSSGLAYYEAQFNGTATSTITGPANSTATLSSFIGGDANSVGWRNDGNKYINSGSSAGAGAFVEDFNSCRANTSYSTGKYYFEIHADISVNNALFVGIADASANLITPNGYPGGNAHSLGYDNTGGVITNTGVVSTLHNWTTGDVIGIATDVTNKKVWFYNATTANWNNDILANQNPVTGTGGYAASSWSGALYPIMGITSNETSITQLTANFGKTAFTYTIPSGFIAWNPVSSQTLTPSLYTNSNTFYSPVVKGRNTLTPGLFTNTNTFYGPLTSSHAPLHAALLTNVSTFYAPLVHAGAITIHPSLYTDPDVFYSPTATIRFNIRPSLFINNSIFFSPTVLSVASKLQNIQTALRKKFFNHAHAGQQPIGN